MSEPVSYRQSLPLEPLAILSRAAAMGRTLVGVRSAGALLERIGVFDGITEESGWIVAHGAAHETRIDPSTIAAIVADRSETPHDTILAYVDFLDSEGRSIVKVTALDGIEHFDAALEGLPRSPLAYVPPLERSAVAVDPSDIGAVPIAAAVDAGAVVTLSLSRPGLFQSWTGKIARIHFGHNYINVLQEDVHLHLRGQQVSRWEVTTRDGRSSFAAIGPEGEPFGLSVEGDAAVFAAIAEAA
ncbi:hypothetical protein C3941_19190 [Kaistia algarum]|uniref:ChuX/HutX family heme-like substrate-binding protein n=1 Tax=Kaistia algarum TaxID=2083279 RepID=UPI000CE81B27|nr:ChuX/HutX family heme-like substrate-binding protein [Kaistia algarum]MCX5516120.1 hypothetical protein [Kaistia algarum]PPE78196.1 hypothetical protein C3941_19190 [Kaistia algarum]